MENFIYYILPTIPLFLFLLFGRFLFGRIYGIYCSLSDAIVQKKENALKWREKEERKMNRTSLETELQNLYKEITTYKDGIFRNMSLGDESLCSLFTKTFPNHESLVRSYVNLIYELQKTGKIGTDIPLPPFIVFAFYSPITMGWRMGAGEGYEEVWYQMIDSLSKEELARYCSQYEYPEWWKDYWKKQNGVDIPSRYQNLPWKNIP